MCQLPHILPDYMLVFAVPVLTHDPRFTRHTDPVQLRQIERCLWMILEPLVNNKEFFCFGFYKNLIERMKNHKDSLKPDDEDTNNVSLHLNFSWPTLKCSNFHLQKLWAICDIALGLILTKVNTFDAREFPVDARIPSMYFQAQPESFHNDRLYIPEDMYHLTGSSSSAPAKKTLAGVSFQKVDFGSFKNFNVPSAIRTAKSRPLRRMR